MVSITRNYVVLISLCMLAGQVSAGDIVTDFAKCLNGKYTNSKQVIDDISTGQAHDPIQTIFMPISVAALPGLSIYFDETSKGVVIRRRIWSLSADKDNNVRAQIYKFNYTSSSGDFDHDAVFAALKPEDLSTDDDCVAIYSQLPTGTFTGSTSDCQDIINGKHPRYSGPIECVEYFVSVPPISPESTNYTPYEMIREGPSYQLPNTPAA
uniref:Uncharacterized protein n=1 Tax=Arion vulgaris TaxID=1028688 RepID=A0A0B6Z9Z4_9EUPU